MKLYNKISSAVMLLATVLGFVSCASSDDYTPAEKLTSAQVYFANTLPETQELEKDGTTFTVTLSRVNTSGALNVAINASGNDDGKFIIPSSAQFADGAATADIKIGYNGADLDYDDYTDLVLKISEESYITPYGFSEYKFKAGVPAPWELIGEGTYRELSNGWWGEEVVVKANVYHNTVNTNQYRMESIAADFMGDYWNGIAGDIIFEILPAGSKLGDITTTTNGLVNFQSYSYGYTYSGYGAIYCMHPALFNDYAGDEAALKHNYVSQWAEDGTTPEIITLSPLFWIPEANAGWDMADTECVQIAMPGVVFGDFSLSATYEGRFTSTEGADAAVAYITLGEDIANAKVALVAGTDANAAYEAVLNGTVESVELTESGEVKFPYTDSGKYTLIVIGYNADGNEKNVVAKTVKLTSSSETAETWTKVGTGTYNYNAFWSGNTEGLALYQSSADPTRYKIENWCDTEEAGCDLIFNWNKETNRLTMEEPCYTGYSDDYGKVYMWNYSFWDYDDYYPCSYDPETKTFSFMAVYWYDAYTDYPYYEKDYAPETFVLDDAAATKSVKKAVKSTKKHTNANRCHRRPMLHK